MAHTFETLFTTEKGDFLKHLYPNGPTPNLEQYDLYFYHLRRTCINTGQTELDTMRAKNSQEIMRCIEELMKIENIGSKMKSDLRNTIRDSVYPPVDGNDGENDGQALTAIENTIQFILRIFLTINIREKSFATSSSVTWTAKEDGTEVTLAEFIKNQFPEAKTTTSDEEKNKPFDRKFSAVSLWKNRDVKIQITYDLTKHLYYDAINNHLFIYPLRRWLELHKTSGKKLIPDIVIDETLKSLALLFPLRQARASQRYLKKPDIGFKGNMKQQGHDYPFDPIVPPLNPNICLNDFKLWHDRLSKAYSIFTGPPTSEYQKFREDFKGWFGFWGAVVALVLMTLVFGVLAITFAILAWKDAHKDAEELLDVVKELLDVVKSAAEATPETTVTVTAVRF